MHETSARGWCTGKTQRDQVERNWNKNKSAFYIFICSGWSNFPFSIILFWKYFSAPLLSEKLFRFHFEEYFPWIQSYFLFRTFKIFSYFMASLFLEIVIIIIFLFVIHFWKLFHPSLWLQSILYWSSLDLSCSQFAEILGSTCEIWQYFSFFSKYIFCPLPSFFYPLETLFAFKLDNFVLSYM